MKNPYSILSFILMLIMLPMGLVYSQNGIPDNRGKEFWLMFNRNNNNSGVNLDLFISGEVPTTGQVNLPTGAPIEFSVTPGEITTIDLPVSLLADGDDEISNNGVQVIAENEITVYGLNQKRATTDAFLGLPVDILGNEYLVMSFTSLGGSTVASVLGVVATEDNTTVTIIPATQTRIRAEGVPYQITLQKGQTYQLSAPTSGRDLTGSIITSNNPIAVFSGHTCSNVPSNTTFCDHLIEQVPPVTSLGQSFVTVPLASRRAGDIFRIVATKDGTNVSVYGTNGYTEDFSLNRGEFEELSIPSNVYSTIVSNQAILVAQYSKGQSSDRVISDPFMMLIPPFEQFQNQYTVSTPATGFNRHFINLVVPISQKDKIDLDGSFLDPSIFTDIPGSNFAGAQVEVDEGTHNISGNLAFGTFMYGFGSYNSYGYPGGQALASVEQVRNINLELEQEIQQGTTYCFNPTVTDDKGVPIFGVRVDFEIEGPNEKIGFAVTDELGIANFCYDAINEGTDKIIASVGSATEEASTVTSLPKPESVLLSSLPDEVTFGDEICLTSQVLDQFGNPLEGVEVSFDLNGVFYGTANSDENGRVEFCQTPDEMGDLIVSAYFEGGDPEEAVIKVVSENEELEIESFWLVDAGTNTLIKEIMEGDKIPYATVKDKMVNFMVITDPEKVGSVKLEMESLTQCPTCTPDISGRTENVVPYALYGDINGNYTGKEILPGAYMFSAIPYEMNNLAGDQGLKGMVNFEIIFEGTIDSFALVNATDDTDIGEIMDGDVLDLSKFKDIKFNIRANVPEDQQGGLDMRIEGPVNFSRFEKVMPFAQFGDNGGDYLGRGLPEGIYTLSATAFPFKSSANRGIGGEMVMINFEVIHNSKVGALTLVNADTDEDIMPIMEGTYIDLNKYKDVKLNIRADGKGEHIASMTFQLSGARNYSWTERKVPYAIFGDLPVGEYYGRCFQEGKYKLMVTPYNSDNMMGETLTVNFSAGFDGGDNLRVNKEMSDQLEANSSGEEANNERLEEELIVYPQPSQNFVNILYPSFLAEDAMVMIYKGNGQLIHGGQMSNTPSFNFGSYGSGLYLIHVSDGEKVISKKVFIY